MTPEQKIAKMESFRGMNHGQEKLKDWYKEDFFSLPSQRAIHVAGTNGKGSVITWLEVLLHLQNKSTVSFTSPHLITHNERLHYNGKPISLEKWIEIYDQWASLFEKREMTMFEMDLWMACALGIEKRPDWFLVETGLGGEKDATTILDYPYGIITQIGLDHMAYLGDTKEEIAKAKAGIIQEDMFVVTAETDPHCLEIFQKRCAQKHATLVPISPFTYSSLWPKTLPEYQKSNFLCAKTILELAGFSFDQEMIQKAFETFFWKARFEILRQDPLLVLDGAHNIDGIQALVKSVKHSHLFFDQIFFSVLADKQAKAMLEELKMIGQSITLVSFESYRLADLEKLSLECNLPIISWEYFVETLETTREKTLICGSLYFAGDVLKIWKEMKQKVKEIEITQKDEKVKEI